MSKSVVRKKLFSKGSHPSSGGGGGGDMFKATYDPANLARQVITTAIAGVLLLGEYYTWEKMIGSVIVLISIYFITWRGRE
jgi:hypothetical protein